MSYIKIGEAAKILGINKKTLMRWDKAGLLPAKREEVSSIRYYDKSLIEKITAWFNLGKKHKEHLRKLTQIRKNVDRFIQTKPLEILGNPPVYQLQDLKKAYDEFNKWEEKLNKIEHEYEKFTERIYRGLKK